MTGQKIYEFILNSNIINFLIMMSVLVWIFKKFNLGKIIDTLAKDIEQCVVSSANAVKDALSKYKEVKKEQKNISEKKQLIIDTANNTIQKLTEKNENEIKTKKIELENLKIKTKEIITDKTKEKTANEIKEAVYLLSKETIKENMTDDIQFETIKNALDELDNYKEVKI